jgi:hypothetical protein
LNFTQGLFAYLNGRQCTLRTLRGEGVTFNNTVSQATALQDCISLLGTDMRLENVEFENCHWTQTAPMSLVFSQAGGAGLATTSIDGVSFFHGSNDTYATGPFSLYRSDFGGGRAIIKNINEFPAPIFQLLADPGTPATTVSQRVLPFWLNTIPGTATTPNTSASNIIDDIIEQQCWIYGIELYVDQPITGGSLAVQIVKNGTLLDSGNLNVTLQPLATSATSAAGGNTLTFSAVPPWVVPGMYVYDLTAPNATLPTPILYHGQQTPRVLSVAGGVVTLVPGALLTGNVGLGDNILFSWIAPVMPVQTSAATAAGSAVLTFAGYPFYYLQAYVQPGMLVTDLGPIFPAVGPPLTVIPAATTISSRTVNTVTLSTPVTGAGVASGDLIMFQRPASQAQRGLTLAATQCKNTNIANGAYQLFQGDRIHVQFVTSGFTSASAANVRANVILSDLGPQ